MRYALFFLFAIFVSCSKEQNTITKPTKEKVVVGLLPYKGIDSKYVTGVKTEIEQYYKVEVRILDGIALPQAAFINVKSPRYRADSLIAFQKRLEAKGVDFIIGLTDKDISATKRGGNGKIKKPEWRYADFGIMGLAFCPGNSAVVSSFRLKSADKARQFGRFKKVALHELGHNFGLPHCPDKKCVMTDAVESIKTVDNARPALCNACKKKLDM